MARFRNKNFKPPTSARRISDDPTTAPAGFSVDPEGDWKACTATVPRGCEPCGTVTSQGTTGALVRLAGSRNFVKVHAGQIVMLNQTKIEQALAIIRERAASGAVEMVPVDAAD